MRGTFISRLRAGTSKLIRDQGGNAMMLTAAAIIPVIGIVGSGIDIGRAYMAQLRLQQACDAGVLAGRRAMGGGVYTSAAQVEATKMFAYNYPTGIYESTAINFESAADGPSNVKGKASAHLPVAVMQIFAHKGFNLSVNCTAKLEISNVDIMMVLDVTGSMSQTNSGDTVNRITGLKNATMDFFDTMTSAEVGDGRLRFGVVPYSSTANVGAILMAKNSSWLSDRMLLPSRSPMMRYRWSGGNPPTTVTNGTTTNGAWGDVMPISGFTSSTSCSGKTPPADTAPVSSGSPNTNRTAYYVDQNGTRIYAYDTNLNYTYYNYRYNWTGSKCVLQRRTVTYARPSTSVAPVQTFYDRYRYEDRLFDVSTAKNGASITTDTGDSGANFSASWGGCVMERQTTPFATTDTAPSDALDMDVDTAPTSDEETKWQLLIPELAFPRASGPGSTPSTTGVLSVNSSSVTGDGSTNGSYQRFSRYWPNGWGVCPAAAMKLTTMTASDRSAFNSYISSLQPVGGTYHDSGMVWGLRLLSAEGLFSDENATAPNGRPIFRHIIFMTDGEMSANMGNLTFQGYEWIMKRIGGTSDSTQTARHENRFQQLCDVARRKNITVWVVGFGVALNDSLTNCATSEANAFEAKNSDELNDNFQSIARQISKLRLSQ